MGGRISQVMAGVQQMFKSRNSKKSIIDSLFNRREKSLPEEDVTASIAGTLEEIACQVKKEAAERHLAEDDFFAPTHVLKPRPAESAKAEAPARKDRIPAHRRLTPDQYENMIESSISVLDIAGQIIDRNRAITSKLKKSPA
jgi:hypothetical protein